MRNHAKAPIPDWMREGLEALRKGQREVAEGYLGQAAAQAVKYEAQWVLDEIRTVADVEDAAAGRVRVPNAVDSGALRPMILRAGSYPGGTLTDTVVGRPGPQCRHCSTPAGLEAHHCISCGKELL